MLDLSTANLFKLCIRQFMLIKKKKKKHWSIYVTQDEFNSKKLLREIYAEPLEVLPTDVFGLVRRRIIFI